MLLAGICLGQSRTAHAGPWTKQPGDAYIKVSESYFASDTFISSSGERVQGTDYLALTSALYFEAGLTPRLHLQGYLPWSFTRNEVESLDTRYANAGFGDAQIGFQTTPVAAALPYALRVNVKLPLYDVASIQGAERELFPALGDGQVDVTTWLSLGGSFWPTPLYVLGEVGWRHRTELFWGQGSELEFKDGLALNGQLGYTIRERVLIALNLSGVYTFAQDEVTQSFLSVGPFLGVALGKGFSLEANISPMVWSRNNSPGTTWALGLSWSR